MHPRGSRGASSAGTAAVKVIRRQPAAWHTRFDITVLRPPLCLLDLVFVCMVTRRIIPSANMLCVIKMHPFSATWRLLCDAYPIVRAGGGCPVSAPDVVVAARTCHFRSFSPKATHSAPACLTGHTHVLPLTNIRSRHRRQAGLARRERFTDGHLSTSKPRWNHTRFHKYRRVPRWSYTVICGGYSCGAIR